MKIANDELMIVLSQLNPWWRGEQTYDVPLWHRAVFFELFPWVTNPPAPRAVFLSGARQVGKTTLLLQIIEKLLKEKSIAAENILYVTFDHPIIKLAGIDAVLQAFRERHPKANGYEYLLLDEAQFIQDWQTKIKHQVDFEKSRRIVFTGSSMPLLKTGQESGAGRWHEIRVPTLSFWEYCQLRQPRINIGESVQQMINGLIRPEHGESIQQVRKQESSSVFPLPDLQRFHAIQDLFKLSAQECADISAQAANYPSHFHDYLLRSGFPQIALVNDINQAQRLLREDIVDKILKRDMTAIFGVRRILDLERLFLYLCMHDGGLLDMQVLTGNLNVKRPTAQNYLALLESTHLIHCLQPFGYGKDILRAKYKVYLADAAIASAILLKGKSLLDDSTALGAAAETAVFNHLIAAYQRQGAKFSYWRGKKEREVDLIVEMGDQIIPFEIKYRSQIANEKDLKGILELCHERKISQGYIITKSLQDFGQFTLPNSKTSLMKIPAPLLCYWLGRMAWLGG